MLTPIEAPSFKSLSEAREWVNLQSLSESFYLVQIDYYDDLTVYEFYSFADIQYDGGMYELNVIEVWQ